MGERIRQFIKDAKLFVMAEEFRQGLILPRVEEYFSRHFPDEVSPTVSAEFQNQEALLHEDQTQGDQ